QDRDRRRVLALGVLGHVLAGLVLLDLPLAVRQRRFDRRLERLLLRRARESDGHRTHHRRSSVIASDVGESYDQREADDGASPPRKTCHFWGHRNRTLFCYRKACKPRSRGRRFLAGACEKFTTGAGAGPREARADRSSRSMGWTWRSGAASASACWDRTARARPPPSRSSRGSSNRRRARSSCWACPGGATASRPRER